MSELALSAGTRQHWGGPDYLVPLMTPGQRGEYLVSMALALAALAWAWSWWLQPEHFTDPWRYTANTIVLVWVTIVPFYYLLIVGRAKVPNRTIPVPQGLRVAMVVTKAPSEPFPVLRETLLAMLAQTYPHDTWLADEDPSPETLAWCAANGVFVSTRRGVADYHRATWPRRTRCKEGNLAYFYDHHGYERYDFVAQLDADHVPDPDYLVEILRPFADPRVGYVSAPSICDRNAATSWSARSRLYAEGVLHGPQQAGHSLSMAPLCFGSHYAVRTEALRAIGGLGPELAEDHSTTLMMNAHGWRGVHAIDAIAHGDGPATFADLATQEFQWSRSMMTLLLAHTPAFLGGLPGHLRGRFLFSQLFYPLFSLMLPLAIVLPILAIAFNVTMINAGFVAFLVHFLPLALLVLAIPMRWRANGWLRPVDARFVSWESNLFLVARWPWSLLGVLAAIRDRLTGTVAPFRVTPKGEAAEATLPLSVIAPTLTVSLICALPLFAFPNAEIAAGFYVFTALNAVLYGVATIAIIVCHLRENRGARLLAPLSSAACLRLGFFNALMVELPLLGIVLRAEQGLCKVVEGSGSLIQPLAAGLVPLTSLSLSF
ncbi:glycosyltransferase [Arsenicitalea aurantiaca]|uniref:Glycosyltransferase n=1 Tax=Arsenicitalea aurantiaca TaxID=1783274 RepID=A0A433XL63_9HYPH|nr:cellulose synthase catalytic subunit [Arsenicitalea aurantiaca]RUT34822.1 glycosyltransferase [Arsenicitalea aurantiaca]